MIIDDGIVDIPGIENLLTRLTCSLVDYPESVRIRGSALEDDMHGTGERATEGDRQRDPDEY